MNDEHSHMAAQSIAHYAQQSFQQIADYMTEPSAVYKPSLSLDGDRWCALYGDNLQDGIAGFGDSPFAAMCDFNCAWYAKVKS